MSKIIENILGAAFWGLLTILLVSMLALSIYKVTIESNKEVITQDIVVESISPCKHDNYVDSTIISNGEEYHIPGESLSNLMKVGLQFKADVSINGVGYREVTKMY